MKKHIHSIALVLFLLFLMTTPQTLARFLAAKQGEDEPKLKEITTEGSPLEMEENGSLDQLMGMEDCHGGDEEECVKRRIVAEAHLDYIYTQHHKP